VKRIERLIFKETLRGFTGYTKTDKLYSLTHQSTLGCFDPETEKTKKKVASLKIPDGKEFASFKFIKVQMRDGKVERISDEFGLGRVGLGQ